MAQPTAAGPKPVDDEPDVAIEKGSPAVFVWSRVPFQMAIESPPSAAQCPRLDNAAGTVALELCGEELVAE
jgi:hypothetical protein